jgi:hypothetical protein
MYLIQDWHGFRSLLGQASNWFDISVKKLAALTGFTVLWLQCFVCSVGVRKNKYDQTFQKDFWKSLISWGGGENSD